MNNKTLIIILVALLGIYALTQLLSGNKDRSFDPTFLRIDTSQVDRIEVDLLEGEDFHLERKNGAWKGIKNTVEVEALPNVVTGMLKQMADIKILRITTKDQEKWPNFEIGEDKAKAKITFKNGGKTLRTLIIGGFRFNQQARTAQSFVRTPESDEVYSIDGFSSMNLGQSFDAFRDKTVLQVDRDAISGISIKTPSSKFSFQKTIAGWTDDSGTILDSTKVVTYLNGLTNLRATAFNDDFKRTKDFKNTVSIQTATQPIPFQLHIDQDPGGAQPFVMESTFRPNVLFAGDSTSIYQKLIKTKADFLE